jgi:predicted helicase
VQLQSIILSCSSWQDVERALNPLTDQEKGSAFEELVKRVLTLHPIYRTKLERVWLRRDVPRDVLQHLALPLGDKGIDIVARTFDGDYWTIQAKFRADASSSLTYGELSTFAALSFAVCRNVSFALVCSTTRRVTSVLAGNARVGFLTADFWQNLPAELFAEIAAVIRGEAPLLSPTTPHAHQSRAISKAVEHFTSRGKTRGKFISPCGSGKSLSAYWMAEALGAKRVLVAVPSLFLIGQTLRTWLREAVANGRRVDWLCVCSHRELQGKEAYD